MTSNGTISPIAAQVETFGIILSTERFAECVVFYRDILGLPLWFEKGDLVCLRFGGGYLMIETGGSASNHLKATSQNPTILRFNVRSVENAARDLQARGIAVVIQVFDWGIVGAFTDPDGNACEFKDAGDADFGTTVAAVHPSGH
jgi:lactoylglutathione lyase